MCAVASFEGGARGGGGGEGGTNSLASAQLYSKAHRDKHKPCIVV